MTSLAIIAVRLAEGILAASARDRWHAVQNLPNSSSSYMSSPWFKIVALSLFVLTVSAFIGVSLYNRYGRRKIEEREFAQAVSRKQLTDIEISTLVEIADRVGVEKAADIFLMNDAFEKGAGILLNETFVGGNPTHETSQLERHIGSLRTKINFRKVTVGGGGYYPAISNIQSKDSTKGKTSFVALFPFVKMDLKNRNGKGSSPPGIKDLLPEFQSAIVTGLVGHVLFIETTVPANVGDRVIVIISPQSAGKDSEVSGIIEDIGTVEQSSQPAQRMKEPNARRIGVTMAGLTDSQIAQLSGTVKGINTKEEQKQNTADSKEKIEVSQPFDKKEPAK